MPYVEGESLRARLAREGELPVGEAVRLLRDVVDALACAHQHGVVHRDIKPDNVLLSGHHAMVADFGVAKALSAAADDAGLTSAGMAIGTPAYMAPEQAAADPHADHRVDIYAVGAMAYEMLTGHPPFTGATPQAVLAAQLTDQPRPLVEARPSVPPALEALVLRCLQKRPADRWQSAQELLQHGWRPSPSEMPTRRPYRRPARGKPRSASLGRRRLAGALLLIAAGGGRGVELAAIPSDAGAGRRPHRRGAFRRARIVISSSGARGWLMSSPATSTAPGLCGPSLPPS